MIISNALKIDSSNVLCPIHLVFVLVPRVGHQLCQVDILVDDVTSDVDRVGIDSWARYLGKIFRAWMGQDHGSLNTKNALHELQDLH